MITVVERARKHFIYLPDSYVPMKRVPSITLFTAWVEDKKFT